MIDLEVDRSVLLTDLYELTMAHAYYALGMRETAVFELFVRRLPPTRHFLLAAGLEQIVEYLEAWRFTPGDIEFLSRLKIFPRDFLEYLSTVRFTGSVHAMAEGTPYFSNEPILRVTGPILEAQLVESRILNLAHFQSVIAGKAARCVLAARGEWRSCRPSPRSTISAAGGLRNCPHHCGDCPRRRPGIRYA